MKKLLYIAFIFWGCTSIKTGKNSPENTTDLRIEVRQMVYDSYTETFFSITGNRLVIHEKKSSVKRVYSGKIKPADIPGIEKIAGKVFDLKNEYMKSEIGGIRWEISCHYQGRNKDIVIENVAVPTIDSLFAAINKNIPKKFPVLYKY